MLLFFKDELQEWCDKGYDYIGAPWIATPKHTLVKVFFKFARNFRSKVK
jgi:hypothetical protein